MSNCGVASAAERRQPVAAVGLQIVHLGVADAAQLGDRPAAGEQGREPWHGADHGARLDAHASPGVPGEHADDELDDREGDDLEEANGQPRAGRQRERRAQVVAGAQRLRG